jgi:hypothetical protein
MAVSRGAVLVGILLSTPVIPRGAGAVLLGVAGLRWLVWTAVYLSALSDSGYSGRRLT